MSEAVKKYSRLLATIDAWFSDAQKQFPQVIRCRLGCSGCCRGFFDVSLLDAALVNHGYQQLVPEQREVIRSKAAARLKELQQRWPGFSAPFLLNGMPDSEWVEMPESDETPCPFLGDDELCQIYDHRPMTCRLHGLPNIDYSGESFSDDYCSLNFQTVDPLTLPQLQWGFRQAFQQELELFALYTRQLTGSSIQELDILLPLVPLLDFEQTDWRNFTLYTLPESKGSK